MGAEEKVRMPWKTMRYGCGREVLWEFSNWKNVALAIVHFIGYVSKLILALVVRFIGPPVTALIWCFEFVLNLTRSIYSGIVASAPVPELLWIIILTSTVMAIAEAIVPDSVSSQPYLLTAAGLLAYGAVGGAIPELLFWLAMTGIFCYSRFIKKRDVISAALPPAAMLVAIGEPWVRGLTMASYLVIAIIQHSRCPEADVKAGRTLADTNVRAPVPLQLAALAIGIHLAAKWSSWPNDPGVLYSFQIAYCIRKVLCMHAMEVAEQYS
ncbi:hypothetical protein Taro_043633 [Colocasia esculenta]|uniref:Uncharacterized protein n=1 Tax=Colocasia esculenta TaxID=4460 RepID=A0A843X127_COLES|nr:hypothetical protein [Colocasia esculenta]